MSLLQDYELHGLYDSFLDECYGEVSIAGYTYATSEALKRIDPTAYRCGFNDWLDFEVKNGTLFCKDDEYYDSDPDLESEE